MDVFIEQIIKKEFDLKDLLFIICVILGGFLIIALSVIFLPLVLIPVIIGAIFADYYLISSKSIEYEYSVTNGDITIDKITNRSRRKRVISIDAKDIESIGRFRLQEHTPKNFTACIDASRNKNAKDVWCFSGHHQKKGNVFVLFSPNEKVLKAIKPFLSRQVATDAFGRN